MLYWNRLRPRRTVPRRHAALCHATNTLPRHATEQIVKSTSNTTCTGITMCTKIDVRAEYSPWHAYRLVCFAFNSCSSFSHRLNEHVLQCAHVFQEAITASKPRLSTATSSMSNCTRAAIRRAVAEGDVMRIGGAVSTLYGATGLATRMSANCTGRVLRGHTQRAAAH